MSCVRAADQLLRRYRAACDREDRAKSIACLETLFWAIHERLERSVDLNERDCFCSLERRLYRAEQIVPVLIAIAKVYCDSGAQSHWIADEFETLGGRVADVCERLSKYAGG